MPVRAPAAFALAALVGCSPASAQRLGYDFAAAGEEPVSPSTPPTVAADPSGPRLHYALLDRLEWAPRAGGDGYAWDFSALIGGDTNRLWLSGIGEGALWSGPEYLEFQALYARAVGGGWDLNAGLRYDAVPKPTRLYLAAGGQMERELGRADLWLGAFAYFSHRGELSARISAVYNQPLGGRIVLQPSAEINASAEDVPALGLGRGLSYAEAGLRLRYRAADAFAPYVGVSWERSLGRTARMARAAGEDVGGEGVVVGVRSEF